MTTRIPPAMIADWQERTAAYLEREFTCTRLEIGIGRNAWNIAHKLGLVQEAYALGRDVLDAHVQTALEQVFPNAKFLDKKRY